MPFKPFFKIEPPQKTTTKAGLHEDVSEWVNTLENAQSQYINSLKATLFGAFADIKKHLNSVNNGQPIGVVKVDFNKAVFVTQFEDEAVKTEAKQIEQDALPSISKYGKIAYGDDHTF